jgi:hypothetical protein
VAKARAQGVSAMTKDEARKELLETLEEYCHDKGYNLQVFAGMADWVYTLYPKKKTMTNADKIRGMTDKELADFLFSYVEPCFLCAYKEQGTCAPVDKDCSDGRLMWLKKEADND